MSDLWFEASADHDLEAREAALAQAEAQMMPVYGFLFQARSGRELEHRLAFAGERLERIASACGLPPGELEETARRRYALLKEALPEGVDPVLPVLQSGQGFGTGPERPVEHEEGPDFSGGYSEIPAGPLGGPDPAVTGVPGPAMGQPQQQATASLCSCGSQLTKKAGKCKSCRELPGECMCRTAQGPMGMALSGTPDLGRLSQGTGPAPSPSSVMGMPAGTGGATATPDGMSIGGRLPGAQSSGGMSATQPGVAAQQYDLTPGQDVTAARRDPVRRQIEAIAASVAASNPQLPSSECRRIARRVVGGYLRRADLASGVMSDEPWASSPGADSGSGAGGGGGDGMLQHGLEWRGLKSMLPGGGAGAAGEAGAGLADVAELAAL
jgi:hypothetical protein